jgi:hypothetical protein
MKDFNNLLGIVIEEGNLAYRIYLIKEKKIIFIFKEHCKDIIK